MSADRVLLGAGGVSELRHGQQDQTYSGGKLHACDVYDVEALAVKGLLVLDATGLTGAG
jgi:hypothetical protein